MVKVGMSAGSYSAVNGGIRGRRAENASWRAGRLACALVSVVAFSGVCRAQTSVHFFDSGEDELGILAVESPVLAASAALQESGPTSATPAQAQPSTPQSATTTPAAQPSRPNLASLGRGRYRTLTRSSAYASPVALSLGAGGGAATSRASAYFGTSTHRNLLKTPEMFGDFRRPYSSLNYDPFFVGGTGGSPHDSQEADPGADFPSAGSFSGMRVSENNVALPQDRIWTSFHHYHNAFQMQTGDTDLNRFIIGFEKTFGGGTSSLEFRLPISGSLDPVDPNGNTAFAGGSFGNLDVIYKRVLLATDDRVLAVGLRVETPTGSKWHSSDNLSGPASFTVDPHAVYITPYVGALREINDIWFINSFLQVDIATGGDRLLASLNGNPAQEFRINQPPLLQIDVGGGVWLVTPSEQQIGWAAVSELHMAFALDDDDAFLIDPTAALPNIAVDQVPIRNLVNFTNGLHAQLDEFWSVRAGISVPLLVDRIFDTEVMVQINRNY